MLDEYKELCRSAANVIPDWEKVSKNDLCRAYVSNKNNPYLQNGYFSAVLYKYWNLISKYYYMSVNCATPEDCYGWLVDSVSCCLNLASWENPDSSIYRDENGPDKVINRCMKCARLTHYQFINRKKRKDNFGSLSLDELKESFGDSISEPTDYSQEFHISDIVIEEYVVTMFNKKDYFMSFLIGAILCSSVFDTSIDSETETSYFEFNIRKFVKFMNNLDDDFLFYFSNTYNIAYEDVVKAYKYVKAIPAASMRSKVVQYLERLKHSEFVSILLGRKYAH